VLVSALILDGKVAASAIKNELRTIVSRMDKKPGLGTILVGDDPGSHAYVNGKHSDCAEVGIESIRINLPANASEPDILKAISELNNAAECTGYIVQLPVPKGIDTNLILNSIDPVKDADGLHPLNLGKLILGEKAPRPCTARGILELLRHFEIKTAGAEVVVMGRGLTVGRPLALLLSQKGVDATVTITHTLTKDALWHTKRADIVIAAFGKSHFLKPDSIKEGSILLDVGITRTSNGLLGDIDPSCAQKASYFAPMPGGVGPMTRAMLLQNVVEMAQP
jgi:methylenetetrahydrofolate dehydrogenase (NADP+) / methenyltetrahydrofolate cyclohydrolase